MLLRTLPNDLLALLLHQKFGIRFCTLLFHFPSKNLQFDGFAKGRKKILLFFPNDFIPGSVLFNITRFLLRTKGADSSPSQATHPEELRMVWNIGRATGKAIIAMRTRSGSGMELISSDTSKTTQNSEFGRATSTGPNGGRIVLLLRRHRTKN